MRLIDADALKEIFLQDRCGDNFLPKHFVISTIDNAPTVSEITKEKLAIAYEQGYEDGKNNWLQEERPKGEWICDAKYLDCKCSICNSYALERGDYPELSPYCPQCGAKMEVKTNENND